MTITYSVCINNDVHLYELSRTNTLQLLRYLDSETSVEITNEFTNHSNKGQIKNFVTTKTQAIVKALRERVNLKLTEVNDESNVPKEHTLAYLYDLLTQTLEPGFDDTKANRWIGYVQGILIARGLSSVSEERTLTRTAIENASIFKNKNDDTTN